MREQFTGPGKYEGLSPFHAFIAENIYRLADEASGDVEAPTGWFAHVDVENVNPARRRSFLVSEDSQGFMYVTEYADFHAAGVEFDRLDKEYAEWSDDSDDSDDETCRHCDRPVISAGHCTVHIGDLCSEVAYAESFSDDE